MFPIKISKNIGFKSLLLFVAFNILTFYFSGLFSVMFLVPVFVILNSASGKKKIFLFYFLMNAIATYWLCKIDFVVGVYIWLANALLMSISFWLANVFANKMRINKSLLFISFWLLLEQLHFMWYISWPWLNLGNIIGSLPILTLWYRIFGAMGGSVWILAVNYCVYRIIFCKLTSQLNTINKFSFATIASPVLFSVYLYMKPIEQQTSSIPILGITPNVNFIHTKILSRILLDSLFGEANSKIKEEKSLVVLPENIIYDDIIKREINNSALVSRIRNLVVLKKELGCVFGSVILSDNPNEGDANFLDPIFKVPYSKFGAAIYIDSTKSVYYHLKRKLIPKEEYLPKELNDYKVPSEKLSHCNDYTTFIVDGHQLSPVICYEALFGEDLAKSINDGGEAFIMIANEQLFPFKESDDYYKNICKIRSIENNRYLLKVSNKGFTGLISPKGEVVEEATLIKYQGLKCELPLISATTFYTQNAGWIHLFFLFQPLLVIFFSIAQRRSKHKQDVVIQ